MSIISNWVNNFFQKTKQGIEKNIGKPISAAHWALVFLGIIAIRIFIEFFLASSALKADEILIEYLHNLFFFALAFLMIWLSISIILRENPAHLAYLILGTAWLIVLPPILDILKTGGAVYWSFYVFGDLHNLWGQFITLFGRLPSGIVYFGSKIVFILSIIFSAGLVLVRSQNWLKAFAAGCITYAILFFLGCFPSFFTMAYYLIEGSKKIQEVNEIEIVQFLGVPYKIFGTEFFNLKYSLAYNLDLVYYLLLLGIMTLVFYLINKQKALAMLNNLRFPQIIYHSGLFVIGLGLGFLAYPENFHLNLFSVLASIGLIFSIWLLWAASVIINDIYDFKIDEISNSERPLQRKIFTFQEYQDLGIVVLLFALLGALVISLKFFALALIYQFLAWTYSAPPFRFKRFPIIATFISAMASLIVLFMGFTLFSGDQNTHGLSWRIILLLMISLTLSLPVKDFKDMEGDKKYGVRTIPVIFGEEKGRLIVAVGVYLSFMLSVFLLNEFHLFWWAILFGGISFMIIAGSQKAKSTAINGNGFIFWIKPRQLFWWVLGSVGLYVIVLAKIVFL